MKNAYGFLGKILFVLLFINLAYAQTIGYQCQETYPTDVHGRSFNADTEYVRENLPNLVTEKPDTILTKEEIENLAEECGLYEKTEVNSHLRFKDGDIAFWYEQQYKKSKLRSSDLRLEFVSRRIILLTADKLGISIETHGDLSHAAQRIQSKMQREKVNYMKYLEQIKDQQ